LNVSTRTPGKAEAFVQENLPRPVAAGTIEEVARKSDVIIVCVTDSPDVVAGTVGFDLCRAFRFASHDFSLR
jgi:3-hydroxyisobutyrate dehydrogenase-like beta-hydroxyacid dehydrogenase